MTTRNYSSTAQTTTLSAPCSDTQTTISLSGTVGLPAAPFVLALDAGTASQELVLVTTVTGLNLTVTRGFDSTSAVAHLAGAPVWHTHAAVDFRDSRAHEAATTNVHGVSGALVGLTGGFVAANLLGSGAPGPTTYLRGDQTWATMSGSALIGYTSYCPASTTPYAASTTTAAVDPTNLSVTFTAPPSGTVVIRLSGVAFVATGANGNLYWSLRTGGSNVTGSERKAGGSYSNGTYTSPLNAQVVASIRITGLSGGTSYTYQWAHRTDGPPAALQVGGTEFSGTPQGPATIEVWSA